MENRDERLGKGRFFERIRRITGYLVGTLDKWNNAKKAEDDSNKRMRKDEKASYWECKSGVKAQYEHARCIVRKLSYEINKEMWAI